MDDLLDDDNAEFGYESDGQQDLLDEEIEQSDAWEVINKFFKFKGMVAQQLDSFDEFIAHTLQEMIDDNGIVSVTSENQYRGTSTEEVCSLFISPLTYIKRL